MTDPLTLTKLIILYMLDSVESSMPKSKIFSFIIDNDYTNYFTLMQASSDLLDAGFISAKINKNSTIFSITEDGKNTLDSFADRISHSIRRDIAEYLKSNFEESGVSLSFETNYYRNGFSGYVADLLAKEKNTEILNVKITLPTEEAAAELCKNFEEKGEDIYDLLIDNLL